MSFFSESELPMQCCYCTGPLPSDLNDDYADACTRECAYGYALLALEGKVKRPEYSTSANSAPPSTFSPDSSDEELPELPDTKSLDNESMYRESTISTAARASTECSATNEEFMQGPTRPATPTPDSANQHERARNTRLLRAMFTATNRRADKVPRVQFEDNQRQQIQSGIDGSAGTVRKIVSVMVARSHTRPVRPDDLQARSRFVHEQ